MRRALARAITRHGIRGVWAPEQVRAAISSAHAAPSRPEQRFRATAQRSRAPSRLQQRFPATVQRFRAPHPPPADPFGANTKQNPICGKSNAEMEPTYNINDRLRHMGRRLPTYPRTQSKILFVGNRKQNTDQHIL